MKINGIIMMKPSNVKIIDGLRGRLTLFMIPLFIHLCENVISSAPTHYQMIYLTNSVAFLCMRLLRSPKHLKRWMSTHCRNSFGIHMPTTWANYHSDRM
jgi:hypothetical protein